MLPPEFYERAVKFDVGFMPISMGRRVDEDTPGVERVYIERRSAHTWSICRAGLCLAQDGEWEYEPSPSSRSEEFIQSTRFDSLESAWNHWVKHRDYILECYERGVIWGTTSWIPSGAADDTRESS